MSNLESKSDRPKRTPLHKQKLMEFTKRAGFVRRIVNDIPGRIEAFKSAGWTHVMEDGANISYQNASSESQIGSPVRIRVNKSARAEAHYAYLMEIPEEWYNEDQEDKVKAIKELEASYDPTKASQQGADYGYMKVETK